MIGDVLRPFGRDEIGATLRARAAKLSIDRISLHTAGFAELDGSAL
jgi:hypothetical protein